MTSPQDEIDELRQNISKTMGWWSPDGFDAYPERTEKVVALIHDREARAVNRLEVIDHTPTGTGRDYVKWVNEPFTVETSLQDGGRTLKIFLAAIHTTDKGTEVL